MVIAKEDCPDELFLKSKDGKGPIIERRNAHYKDYSSGFKERATDFSKQFAHMYACRLGELRQILIENSKAKWGEVDIVKLADLEHQEENRCVVIGTLYKHQQWKPSILRELCDEAAEEVIIERGDDYCDDKDQPFLEDEMLRIKLVGDKIDIRQIVTGVVCAVIGHKTEFGTFDMEDWCFPGCPLKASLNRSPSTGKLVLVSTLDLVNNSESLATSLLAEWINGMAGNLEAQTEQATVVRLVITGNSVSATAPKKDKDFLINAADNNESLAQISGAIEKLDCWLDEILGHCCVTLMPGQHDPTNYMLPQKPLHRFMLRKSFRYGNFKGASNPWIGKVDNCVIMGSSGQPIEDIMRVCGPKSEASPLEWLEKTLDWRHLCPTAPDTLPSHPYYEKDLFIMKECPDIYFVGNTEKFETKLFKGKEGQIVRLICVPRFSSTKCAVIVDLETLDAQTISFGTS